MPIPKSQLETVLKNSLPKATIEVEDLVGDNNHYRVTILDESFRGKNRIEQHRLVNGFLKNELESGQLHAMQLITKSGSPV
jgi:stress-induced morphogen